MSCACQGVSVQSQNWSRRCEKGEKTRLQASRPRDRRRPLLSGSERKECRSGLHPRRPRSLLQSCHGKIAIMLSPCSRAQQGPPKAGPVSWPAPRAASTTIASKLAPRAGRTDGGSKPQSLLLDGQQRMTIVYRMRATSSARSKLLSICNRRPKKQNPFIRAVIHGDKSLAYRGWGSQL